MYEIYALQLKTDVVDENLTQKPVGKSKGLGLKLNGNRYLTRADSDLGGTSLKSYELKVRESADEDKALLLRMGDAFDHVDEVVVRAFLS